MQVRAENGSVCMRVSVCARARVRGGGGGIRVSPTGSYEAGEFSEENGANRVSLAAPVAEM